MRRWSSSSLVLTPVSDTPATCSLQSVRRRAAWSGARCPTATTRRQAAARFNISSRGVVTNARRRSAATAAKNSDDGGRGGSRVEPCCGNIAEAAGDNVCMLACLAERTGHQRDEKLAVAWRFRIMRATAAAAAAAWSAIR